MHTFESLTIGKIFIFSGSFLKHYTDLASTEEIWIFSGFVKMHLVSFYWIVKICCLSGSTLRHYIDVIWS